MTKRQRTAWRVFNNEELYKRKRLFNQLMAAFLICILLVGLLPATAQAATLTIKYNGKKTAYTGAQTKITLDGKNVNLKGTPGILLNSTNMVSYYDVFRSGLKAETSYDSSTGKLLISYYNNTIEMTKGSKTAYVNGKKKTMDVAPTAIYFYSIKKTKIYVPAGFVAEALGCSYTWNNSLRTGQITSPYIINMDGEWIAYSGTKGKVTYNNKSVNVSSCPSIIKDNTALLSAAKVFKNGLGADYIYDSKTKQITISQNNVQIIMEKGSCEATVNGVPHTLATAPRVIKIKSTGKSYVMVPGEFVASSLGYSYKWNSSTGTSMITKKNEIFFQHSWDGDMLGVSLEANMINTLKAQTNNMSDQLVIDTRYEVAPIITQDLANSCFYIDIPDIYSGMDTIQEVISKGNYMTEVLLTPGESSVRLTVYVKPDCGYYTMASGTTTTLVICDSGNVNTTYQMKIPVTSEISFKDIKTEDHYESNYFNIIIPGDITAYLAANPIVFNSEEILQVTYNLNASGNTVIMVKTYELRGFKLQEGEDFIGVTVGSPSEIYKNIIVLDAGHGGSDPGAMNSEANEKDLTLSIIYDAAKKYFNSPDSPVKAYWTRKDDTKIELNDRAAFADKVEADFFISLHMNSTTSKSAKGMEVLYASKNTNTLDEASSKTIAKHYADYLIETLGMTGRTYTTVDRPNLIVLYKNTVPAILIELGFISNASDYEKISDPEFQDQAAKAIYDATVTLFENYPTGR